MKKALAVVLAVAGVAAAAYLLWPEEAPETPAVQVTTPVLKSLPGAGPDKPPAGPTTSNAKPADGNPAAPNEPDENASPEQVGRAQLTLALEAKTDGRLEQARELFESAAMQLGKAIEQAGDRADPWTLQGMAQAQLELGHDLDAIGWADKALQQLHLGSSDDYTAFKAAQLTMNVGIVYFRAGQKDTGIAYMDQAISLAPTEFDRADFVDLKRETIGG